MRRGLSFKKRVGGLLLNCETSKGPVFSYTAWLPSQGPRHVCMAFGTSFLYK